MAMTLNDMKVGMTDKVSEQVVDIFVRESEILQVLPFDNCVSPSGGSTLTYTYLQTLLPSMAAFRGLNTEYAANEATLFKRSADLKIFGGKFSMDRVLKQAEGKFNNMAFQMEQKIKAAVGLFHYTLINGDATTNALEFDGLDKMLVGTTSEFNADGAIDISTMAKLKENADQFYEMLQNLIKATEADALLLNTATISKIQTMARILGYKTESEEAFGKKITTMDGVRFMDLKNVYSNDDGSPVATPCVPVSAEGLTDIYSVKFDVNDGFHGVTLTGNSGITQYVPDFTKPGAVKDGEVEMVAATVLKNTAHAGVLRNIKLV
jgi:hypothetical protein